MYFLKNFKDLTNSTKKNFKKTISKNDRPKFYQIILFIKNLAKILKRNKKRSQKVKICRNISTKKYGQG